MKILKTILKTITFPLILFPFSAISQENESNWDFPVKPGTEEWTALITRSEKLKVCQIPDSILQTMSTKDLVTTCLNYPLQFSFYIRNNLKEGVRSVARDFNGLQELFRRKDNVGYLLGLLQYSDIKALATNKNMTDLQRGEAIVRLSLIEAILSHELESFLRTGSLKSNTELEVLKQNYSRISKK
jgi:hypothetical protein